MRRRDLGEAPLSHIPDADFQCSKTKNQSFSMPSKNSPRQTKMTESNATAVGEMRMAVRSVPRLLSRKSLARPLHLSRRSYRSSYTPKQPKHPTTNRYPAIASKNDVSTSSDIFILHKQNVRFKTFADIPQLSPVT